MQILFISLIVLLLGLAMLIYGYRIFMVMLPVFGFFIGFWLGADATSLVIGSGFLGSVTGWVIGFLLGLVFSIFSYMFYEIAIAIHVAVIGYGLGSGVIAAFFGPGISSVLIGVLFAIIVFVLAFVFNLQKFVVILITSLLGSNAALLSALLLFGRVSMENLQSSGTSVIPIIRDSWWWLLLWLVLACIGLWSQMRVNRTYTFQRDTYLESFG